MFDYSPTEEYIQIHSKPSVVPVSFSFLNDSNIVIYFFRSAAHVKLKLYDKAVQDARTAKQLKPDWPKVCHNSVFILCEVCLCKNDWESFDIKFKKMWVITSCLIKQIDGHSVMYMYLKYNPL